jgi:hypothetical protein
MKKLVYISLDARYYEEPDPIGPGSEIVLSNMK